MALKIRRGAQVPALQAGEPFFDGAQLHIGKLDGSGNQQIGGGVGSAPYVIVDEDSVVIDEISGSRSYTISAPGVYVVRTQVTILVDAEQMAHGDVFRICNAMTGNLLLDNMNTNNMLSQLTLRSCSSAEFLCIYESGDNMYYAISIADSGILIVNQ